MIAVAVVRAGALPAGADEAAAEAGGRVLLIGEKVSEAAEALRAPVSEVILVDAGAFAPGRFAAGLATLLRDEAVVILPASPDGRDLAPRLAHALGRPLLAGAVAVQPPLVLLARLDGRVGVEHRLTAPAVATLIPGVRGVEARPAGYRAPPPAHATLPAGPSGVDADVMEVTPPDPSTMDLAEASFIVAGGAGLGSADAFATLADVADRLGASMGATRVVTDAGWVPFERQIGTTGVAVNPEVYVAFGISGAVQHTSGLGDPGHVIAVNTDPSCPMMAMADVAIVADAPAVLTELAGRLSAGGDRRTAGAGGALR